MLSDIGICCWQLLQCERGINSEKIENKGRFLGDNIVLGKRMVTTFKKLPIIKPNKIRKIKIIGAGSWVNVAVMMNR